MSDYFIQTENIDLTPFLWDDEEDDYINDGNGWIPIGDVYEPFSGRYLGNNHIISGRTINRPDKNYQGFFGFIFNARIDEVTLTGVDIIGEDFVAGLFGSIYETIVSNCSVTGKITAMGNFSGGLIGGNDESKVMDSSSEIIINGDSYLGGLVAISANSIIENCNSVGDINGKGRVIGGLIGEQHSSKVLHSYSNNTVTGSDWHTGGLVALNHNSIIDNCHSTGNVWGGGPHTGGLVGTNGEKSKIINSFSSGDVAGKGHSVGGLVGRNFDLIENSYSSGTVTGKDNRVGGLIGMTLEGTIKNDFSIGSVVNDGLFVGGLIGAGTNIEEIIVENSYWNIQTTGQDSSIAGEGRNTHQMTYPYDELTYVEWDFNTIWTADTKYDVNHGYPYLYDITVSIDDNIVKPEHNLVLKNYPNPFNPHTTIKFNLSHNSDAELIIYNTKGQIIKKFFNNNKAPGEHTILWNGRDNMGRKVRSGVYFYKLKTDYYVKKIKC